MELDVIEFQVKDFEKTVDWYKKLFKILYLEDHFAMFDAGKASLAIDKGKENKAILYFNSKNLETDRKELKEKGIAVSRIQKVGWGRKFFFTDPGGFKHFVCQKPVKAGLQD